MKHTARFYLVIGFLLCFTALVAQEPATETDTKTDTIELLSEKEVTDAQKRAIHDAPIPLKEDEQVVITNFADIVNSFFNIVRDPRNPHNVATNMTNVLANIVNIALLATKRSVAIHEETGEKISEEAIRAYISMYIAQMSPEAKNILASMITHNIVIS
jgi:hypothetical protein